MATRHANQQVSLHTVSSIRPLSSRRCPLVLVVEDHPVMRQTLLDILTLDNITGVATDNGTSALALVETHRPDLLLLDMNLAGALDGLDVLLDIRANSTLASTPVILLTVDDVVTRTEAVAAADIVLLKPVDPDLLLRLIHRLLDTPYQGEGRSHDRDKQQGVLAFKAGKKKSDIA
jgi:two-component system, OmpR family, response regulator